MKWHGWGSPNFVFPMDKKPSLWPWIKAKLGVDESIITKPVDRAQIVMPAPILNAEFVAAIQTVLSPDQILSGDDDRLRARIDFARRLSLVLDHVPSRAPGRPCHLRREKQSACAPPVRSVA